MHVSIAHTTDRANFSQVTIGRVTVVFSYQTPIAVTGPTTNYKTVASENLWSNTTGKHLNAVSQPKDRLPRDEFLKALDEALSSL